MSDCRDCGACCFSESPEYVRVTGDDYARLGDHAPDVTLFVGNKCYMRMDGGRCASLRLVSGRYVCAVYEARPAICRELLRGSPECLAELTLKRRRAVRAAELEPQALSSGHVVESR